MLLNRIQSGEYHRLEAEELMRIWCEALGSLPPTRHMLDQARRAAQYMCRLEDNIQWCTQDGIMSDSISLQDANTHHEQGIQAMCRLQHELGLNSRKRRR